MIMMLIKKKKLQSSRMTLHAWKKRIQQIMLCIRSFTMVCEILLIQEKRIWSVNGNVLRS